LLAEERGLARKQVVFLGEGLDYKIIDLLYEIQDREALP
jgi:hypothetical protein